MPKDTPSPSLADERHKPIHAFHVPTKPGAPELMYLALAIFRAGFADDEDEAVVAEKWNEWGDDERAKAIRKASFVLNALGGNGSVLQALRPTEAHAGGNAVEQLAYFVENPSAWENFDQKASDAIAAALPALNAGEREKRAFNHGYLIAVSTMLHQHDEPVMAEDALRDSGLRWDTVKKLGLDEFDLKVLRPVFRDMERKGARDADGALGRGGTPIGNDIEERGE